MPMMTTAAASVLTVGHSAHSADDFAALLAKSGVTAIADVRSSPYSRQFPHFAREALAARLKQDGIAYVFLGRELGGRPADGCLYRDGVADYDRMASTPGLRQGLDRVLEGASRYRIALMCSEAEPLECHRCLLLARTLRLRGVGVGHVLCDGTVEAHAATEGRLLAATARQGADLFASEAELLDLAYEAQRRRFAFAQAAATTTSTVAAE
jgi:uncharacterized protein (DUF488 family)